jgi:hypothetical protein
VRQRFLRVSRGLENGFLAGGIPAASAERDRLR